MEKSEINLLSNFKTPQPEQICAIITTHIPEPCLKECVNILIQQVNEIVIVDDGESEENVEKLRKWFNAVSKVTIWHQKTNSGIAAALNVGVKIVQKKGYQWVLTFDDDSIPYNNMVKRLCEYLARIEGQKPVGIIGMNRIENNNLSVSRKRKALSEWIDKRGIITSGSLFSLETYAAIGPFREEFIIDSVDYDFCMRARGMGFRVIQVQELGFIHSSGEKESFKIAGLVIDTVSHSPSRIYYNIRNSTILAKEYILKDPLFVCETAITQVKLILRILFLQKNKLNKLRAIKRGFIDAMKGKMGKLRT